MGNHPEQIHLPWLHNRAHPDHHRGPPRRIRATLPGDRIHLARQWASVDGGEWQQWLTSAADYALPSRLTIDSKTFILEDSAPLRNRASPL